MSVRVNDSINLLLLSELHDMSDNKNTNTEESDFYKILAKKQLQNQGVTEIIRRIMPDGTIRVTKYSGNHIDSCYRTTPNHFQTLTDTNNNPFANWPIL
jgi:hypothetical protein